MSCTPTIRSWRESEGIEYGNSRRSCLRTGHVGQYAQCGQGGHPLCGGDGAGAVGGEARQIQYPCAGHQLGRGGGEAGLLLRLEEVHPLRVHVLPLPAVRGAAGYLLQRPGPGQDESGNGTERLSCDQSSGGPPH